MKFITRQLKQQLKQVLALIVAWNCAFGNVFAQRMPLTVKQNQALMTVIERINTDAQSADDWLKRSQEGLAEIRTVWERAAIDLVGRDMFIAGVEQAFERAYVERLTESFFGANALSEHELYQSLMIGDATYSQVSLADRKQLLARCPELAYYAHEEVATKLFTNQRDTRLESSVVLELAERSTIRGTDDYMLASINALDSSEARSAWLRDSTAESRKENEALLAACAGADAYMKKVIEQGLSYLTEAETVLNENAQNAIEQSTIGSDERYYRTSYFHPDLAPDSAALALYARFTAEKSSWIETVHVELESPTAERGFIAEDAYVLARTYQGIHIPVRDMSEVIADYRENIRLMDLASADTVVPDTENVLQLEKSMVAENKMEHDQERTNSKQKQPIPAVPTVLYIEQPKPKRKRKDDEGDNGFDTDALNSRGDTENTMKTQLPARDQGITRKPIADQPGAALMSKIKDDGFINDAFETASDTRRAPSTTNDEQQNERQGKEKVKTRIRGSGNGAVLIDGVDTVATVEQEARNVSDAVVRKTKQGDAVLLDNLVAAAAMMPQRTNPVNTDSAIPQAPASTIPAPPPLIAAKPTPKPVVTQVGFYFDGSDFKLATGSINVATTPPYKPTQNNTKTQAAATNQVPAKNKVQTTWNFEAGAYSPTPAITSKVANTNYSSSNNTFTITKKNGTTITLDKIDDDNLVNDQLIQQKDFASGAHSNTTIANAGCNFLSIAAVGQMLAGKALTKAQLLEIWNVAQQTDCTYKENEQQVSGKIITNEGRVNNPDRLLDLVFEKLGVTGIGASVGWDASHGRGQIVCTIVWGDTQFTERTKNRHATLGDVNGNVIWDPYNPDLSLTNTSTYKVYIYGK